ncbi:MAG: bifunctional glutamate N-acetyltransferase/amino-acid acetyltransferase ArgJ [Caldilineales bacterium]
MTPFPLPAGFHFTGVPCGIKPHTAAYSAGQDAAQPLDLALVFSDAPCQAAGVFTQNRFPAAPVVYDRALLQANATALRAVVINAGNANACTGEQGLADTARSAAWLEAALGLPAHSALVMSTGVIGLPLPMDKIEAGIAAAATHLRANDTADGLNLAAHAIMTTDTRPKLAAQRVGPATLLGIAKGAAMIHPNMATMLGVLVTDAALDAATLHALLRGAVERSFNAITVDGDTSTNDTVLLLANGAAGPVDTDAFAAALAAVCTDLAQQIVRDAEGATKFITVRVTGATTAADARQVAQTIATSSLVKTAVYGGDPNWGRVLAAAGRSGVALDPQQCALWFAGDGGAPYQTVAQGVPCAYDESVAAAIFACQELEIHLDLGAGTAEATLWTSDLTHDYVSLNAHYRT